MAEKRNVHAVPKYLSSEEIDRLFAAIDDKRDRALFRLIYHRGLRASEPGLMQLSDFQDKSGRMFVRRLKGSNSGEFRLLDVEIRSLRAWIRERGVAPGPLFPSRNRRPISRWRVAELFAHYCELAGIPEEKRHPHALKHSCGTHLSELGENVQIIQDHLGHRNVQNTMIYLQVTNKARDEAADRLRNWGKKAS